MPDDSSIHRIRLAGPWEVVADAGNKRVKMPAGWQEVLGSYCGSAIFKRSFNSPTGLQNQRLYIVLPATHCRGSVWLNNVLLGEFNDEKTDSQNESQAETKFEITSLIQQHNQLKIELICQPQLHPECGLCSPVILEIVP